MSKGFSSTKSAYLAGFLDGDGSIYVRLKPNKDYRYGFQIAPYIVFFQSNKGREKFEKLCSVMGIGYIRERNDGILEYVINRQAEIQTFLKAIYPYLVLKREQAKLMLKILEKKKMVKSQKEFNQLAQLVDQFRNLNYSKKRKRYTLTP